MKAKILTGLVALSMLAGGTARAGHRDAAWAAVGGLVVGAVAGAAIASASESRSVVYVNPPPPPPPAPVVYAPAPVMYGPPPVVVVRGPVCAPPPVVIRQPVCVVPPPVYVGYPPCGPVRFHGGHPWGHRPRGHVRVAIGW